MNKNHLIFQSPVISRENKEQKNRHQGAVVWLTGLPGSGKSTIANLLEAALFKKGCQTIILDGDNIRHGLNSDLGFSRSDRAENIRRIGEVAGLMAGNGLISIVSFVSPFRKHRDSVRAKLRPGEFIEVFVGCSLAECQKRDPKGLYKKAGLGKIKEFTGITSPYEKPLRPEIVLDTERLSAGQCAVRILAYLASKKIIPVLRSRMASKGHK
jgi:adenylylsulfate kinase